MIKRPLILALCVFFTLPFLYPQETEVQKFALVIGNGNYTGLSRLANPINDANDVSGVLQELGFRE